MLVSQAWFLGPSTLLGGPGDYPHQSRPSGRPRFPWKLTPWDSISAILVPMWAVLRLGSQWLKPYFLPFLPSPPWGSL